MDEVKGPRGIAKFDTLLREAGLGDPWLTAGRDGRDASGGRTTDGVRGVEAGGVLAGAGTGVGPATGGGAGRPDTRHFHPDLGLLGRILAVPVSESAASQSGLYGKALDAWFAHEFRCAGFDPDMVWPRASAPRVLPPEISRLIDTLPAGLARELRERLLRTASVAPQDARIRGRAYVKQVDVGISSWSAGPELLVSTKAQNSSFAKNLPNRFEEAYGDAGNLRTRHPLAAVGFAFVMRSTILSEPATLARAVDMMLKLRDRGDGNGYTTTCLLIADWREDDTVQILPDAVPGSLGAGPFMETLIDVILDYAPVSEHTRVRELRDGVVSPS